MEQDFHVFEFLLGNERFLFEAHSIKDAERHRDLAVVEFRARLGLFDQTDLKGPFRVDAQRSAFEHRWVADSA